MADRSPQHNENRQIAATSDVAPKWRSHCFTRRPQGGKDCYTSDSSTLLRFVGHEKTQPTLSRGLGLNNEHLAEAEGFEPPVGLTPRSLSRRVHSAALPRFRGRSYRVFPRTAKTAPEVSARRWLCRPSRRRLPARPVPGESADRPDCSARRPRE